MQKKFKTIINHTLLINTEDFTGDKLKTAINSLSSGKATGLDDIPTKAWKTGALSAQLLKVCK